MFIVCRLRVDWWASSHVRKKSPLSLFLSFVRACKGRESSAFWWLWASITRERTLYFDALESLAHCYHQQTNWVVLIKKEVLLVRNMMMQFQHEPLTIKPFVKNRSFCGSVCTLTVCTLIWGPFTFLGFSVYRLAQQWSENKLCQQAHFHFAKLVYSCRYMTLICQVETNLVCLHEHPLCYWDCLNRVTRPMRRNSH